MPDEAGSCKTCPLTAWTYWKRLGGAKQQRCQNVSFIQFQVGAQLKTLAIADEGRQPDEYMTVFEDPVRYFVMFAFLESIPPK
ncbi:unnamed protein product [Schistocephalus solidus]|uniref:DUF1330 domain-containing protein n=1 Tax=Schistocephalus solidus TaxID=70667 RepID=A0A183TB01_SCHSO|nr:unnamed protein product [Schistocephalus solidus]